tara:strand:+ start:153 stop:995 length:843 start_codon:yes stop_codon:yes gene_type:complete
MIFRDLLYTKIKYYYSQAIFLLIKQTNGEQYLKYLLSKFSFDHQVLLDNYQLMPVNDVLENQTFDDNIVEIMIEKKYISSETDFLSLIQNQQLGETFLNKYQQKLNWSWISYYQILGEDTIKRFKEQVDWTFISYKQLLSINFILEFHDYIDWYTIMKNPFLQLDFIPRCQQYLDWNSVSQHMTINIPLLKQYQERLNWDLISSERILNEQIILEFEDFLNFELLLQNQKQQQVYKYYSQKVIDIVSPHFDSYKIYHQQALVIQNKWKDFKENNFLIAVK